MVIHIRTPSTPNGDNPFAYPEVVLWVLRHCSSNVVMNWKKLGLLGAVFMLACSCEISHLIGTWARQFFAPTSDAPGNYQWFCLNIWNCLIGPVFRVSGRALPITYYLILLIKKYQRLDQMDYASLTGQDAKKSSLSAKQWLQNSSYILLLLFLNMIAAEHHHMKKSVNLNELWQRQRHTKQTADISRRRHTEVTADESWM